MKKFAVGQRVIVTGKGKVPYIEMDGYYGHITEADNGWETDDGRIVDAYVRVRLEGRVGTPVEQWVLEPPDGEDWPFFPDELDHAD